MKIIILLILIAVSTSSFGSACTTIADGSINDPANWDCACTYTTCDTLYVEHNMNTTGLATFAQQLVEIRAAGSLSGDTLYFSHRVVNHGHVQSVFSKVDYTSPSFLNYGTWNSVNFTLLAGITSENFGNITITDSMWSSSNVYNYGMASIGTLLPLAIQNQGVLDVQTISGGLLFNYSIATIGSSSSVNLYNENGAELYLDSMTTRSGMFFEQNGIMEARYFYLDSAELEHGFYATTTVQDLTVGPSSEWHGYGSVCITGSSTNYGDIWGPMNFCDTDASNIVDQNFGTVWGNVNGCQAGQCAVGIEGLTPSEVLVNYLNGSWVVHSPLPGTLSVFDLSGQSVASSTSLPAGIYIWRFHAANRVYSGKVLVL